MARPTVTKLPTGAPAIGVACPMPRKIELMLCTLVAEPFDHEDWIFEDKLDGLRVLCRYDGKTVSLVSRNNKPQDFQFPEIVAALGKSLTKPTVIDGEIVCLDERGRSSFRRLQQRFHLTEAATVAQRVTAFPAYLYVFDILYYDRFDLRGLELRERKRILRRAVKWSDRIRWTEPTPAHGTAMLRRTCRAGGEGIIGKEIHSTYAGGRSDAWAKIKCSSRQEFVIGGFTDPQRSRRGLGALLVGYYDDDRNFRYAGKVGTGYTRDVLLDLRERLGKIERAEPPFVGDGFPRSPGVHWVEPRLVAEVEFGEWTQNDLLRQPRFEGLRMDKKPTAVRRERAKAVARVRKSNARTTRSSSSRRNASKLPSIDGVQFTNVDKLMFPDAGYTKGDLLNYYKEIAPKLLPHLRDRPLTLERLPDGLSRPKAPHFWQKNTPDYYPSWIPRVKLPTERGEIVNYALVNDLRSLLYLVNQGTITFHTFFSRAADLDRPDFVLFDLDPHQSTLANAVKIAKHLHGLLTAAKVKSFVKTSGKTGLHVMVPWTQRGGYDEARGWALDFAQRVEDDLKDIATTARSIKARGKRVYVDVMQNVQGRHAVPPYVVRATPNAAVSTPLEWDELTARLRPETFDIKTALRRFKKQRKDPIASLVAR